MYATELDADLRSAIAERAEEAGLANVVVVEAQLTPPAFRTRVAMP